MKEEGKEGPDLHVRGVWLSHLPFLFTGQGKGLEKRKFLLVNIGDPSTSRNIKEPFSFRTVPIRTLSVQRFSLSTPGRFDGEERTSTPRCAPPHVHTGRPREPLPETAHTKQKSWG